MNLEIKALTKIETVANTICVIKRKSYVVILRIFNVLYFVFSMYYILLTDVPRVLILTKADLLCEKVESNPSNLFSSVKVQKAVKAASEVFAIEQASIHPLINYEVDYELTTDRNIPILLALRQILQYATDRVEYVLCEDD